MVSVTKSLREFLLKLLTQIPFEQKPIINKLIADLLKQTIDVKQFLQGVSSLLKATPPADLESKISAEIAKCKLHIIQKIIAAPTSTPTPAPPSAPIPVSTTETELTSPAEAAAASILLSFKCVYVVQ